VAEACAPEAADLDADALGERLQRVERGRGMCRKHPALSLGSRLPFPVTQFDERAFGVPSDEERASGERVAQRLHEPPRLFGKGPPRQVAQEDEQVRLCIDDVLGGCRERDRVAVHIRKNRDALRDAA
jgi:hypothetical protein